MSALRDGFELQVGDICLTSLETPGHTPESISLVLTDCEHGDEPWAVFTGDTLFIGDVGRPDLSPTHTPQQLADMMFDSLHHKLMALPDKTLVYPAHGAGSLCGRKMRAESSSTIGTERLTNWALQIKSREDFIDADDVEPSRASRVLRTGRGHQSRRRSRAQRASITHT